MMQCVLRIDFRHDKRNLRFQTECAGIINKNSTCSLDGWGEATGDIIFRRTQHDIGAGKSSVCRLVDGELSSGKRQPLSDAAGAGKAA